MVGEIRRLDRPTSCLESHSFEGMGLRTREELLRVSLLSTPCGVCARDRVLVYYRGLAVPTEHVEQHTSGGWSSRLSLWIRYGKKANRWTLSRSTRASSMRLA